MDLCGCMSLIIIPHPLTVSEPPGGQRCTGCKDGVSPKECGTDENRNVSTNLPTYMVYSANPGGPWSEPVMVPSTDVFADSNFAPVILKNGSVVGLMRGALARALG